MQSIQISELAGYRTQVQESWLDYNGHMNLAYYTRAFDRAGEAFVNGVGLGEQHTRETGNSWMVLEMHTTFQNEAVLGDELEIASQILALDQKRLQLFQYMLSGSAERLLATSEMLILHVNLKRRKALPFAEPVMARLQALYQIHSQMKLPVEAGRSIRMASGRPRD